MSYSWDQDFKEDPLTSQGLGKIVSESLPSSAGSSEIVRRIEEKQRQEERQEQLRKWSERLGTLAQRTDSGDRRAKYDLNKLINERIKHEPFLLRGVSGYVDDKVVDYFTQEERSNNLDSLVRALDVFDQNVSLRILQKIKKDHAVYLAARHLSGALESEYRDLKDDEGVKATIDYYVDLKKTDPDLAKDFRNSISKNKGVVRLQELDKEGKTTLLLDLYREGNTYAAKALGFSKAGALLNRLMNF
jgi:hypothetical protein